MAEHRDRLIGFGLLALWAVYCTWGWWGTWGIDGSALYFAGALWADGTLAAIYPPPPEFFWTATPPAWDAIATAKGYPSAELSPYVYPPIWAAVLAPVTGLLTAQGFFNLLTALTFATLALGVWAAYSITRPQRGGFALWAGLSIVVLHSSVAVQFGVELKQPQILISVGTLVVVWLMQRGRGLSAGALLAFLAAIKLAPAGFALLFLFHKNWRALAAFAISGGLFALLSLGTAGWPMHQALQDRLSDLNGQVLVSSINYSLKSVLLVATEWMTGAMPADSTLPRFLVAPNWQVWTVRIILAGALVWIWRWGHGVSARSVLWRQAAALAIVFALTGPLGWAHYLILPLLVLPALLLALPSRSAILIGTCLILAQSYRLTLWIFDQGASPYWPMFLGFGGAVATLYLLSQPPGLTKGQADPTVPRID